MQRLRLRITKDRKQHLRQLQEKTKKQVAKVSVNSAGKRQVTGGRDLKSTQGSPTAFGARVAALHTQWMDPLLIICLEFRAQVDHGSSSRVAKDSLDDGAPEIPGSMTLLEILTLTWEDSPHATS